MDSITQPAALADGLADLRELLWCSIDNDDSRDLDQLTVAEPLAGGKTKILVAVADVDALVAADSPIDLHARHNTTSVYTAAQIFSMLPEKLSTDLTSLSENEDRTAVVTEMIVADDGDADRRNDLSGDGPQRAKLAYNSTAAWLDGKSPCRPKWPRLPAWMLNSQLQKKVSQAMKWLRYQHGALEFDTIEPRADGREWPASSA